MSILLSLLFEMFFRIQTAINWICIVIISNIIYLFLVSKCCSILTICNRLFARIKPVITLITGILFSLLWYARFDIINFVTLFWHMEAERRLRYTKSLFY